MTRHTEPGVVREELALFKQMLHRFLDQGYTLSSAVQHTNALYHHHTPKEDTICLGITQVLQERDIENTFARFDTESGMIEVIETIPWTRKRSPD